MIKTLIAAASVAGALALSTAPAGALPGRADLGPAVQEQAPTFVQWRERWDDDWRPRRHWRDGYVVRRGPPPWAPAWGRRYRERVYGYSYPRRGYYGYGRPRFYDDRPGITLRF